MNMLTKKKKKKKWLDNMTPDRCHLKLKLIINKLDT
jgi:hypothetical protein